MIRALALATAFSLLSVPAEAKGHRSHSATAAFKRQHPCPRTGKPRGACPGWVIDHVVPLCAGGRDDPANMQWQTMADAKAKDREEAKQCRKLRHS